LKTPPKNNKFHYILLYSHGQTIKKQSIIARLKDLKYFPFFKLQPRQKKYTKNSEKNPKSVVD